MKLKILKFIALIALFLGWFSCTSDHEYRFKWDDSRQQEEFRPINPGTKSSSFTIDSNMISFAVPYLVGTEAYEHPSTPVLLNPLNHEWGIVLIMAKGTDATRLDPVITLAPGATITRIHPGNGKDPKQVDYTGIAEIGVYDFTHGVLITVIAPDSSTVTYSFLAVAIGDVLSWPDQP